MSAAQTRTTEKALSLVWQPAFVAALRETGIIRAACEAAKVGRRTAYDARETNPDFARAWDEALEDAADLLEQEAVRRARMGVREPVIYQGRACGIWINDAGDVVAEDTPGARMIPLTVTKYSDSLLIFLLKGIRPDKYRERLPDLPALDVLLAALPPNIREAVRDAIAKAVHPGGTVGSEPAPKPTGGVGGEGRMDSV